MQLIKDGSCYIVNDINRSKFYFELTPRNQGQYKYDAYSLWCKQDLMLREVMDSNIPDICAFACPLLLCTRLSFEIRETIKPVHYCKIIDKAKKVKEGNVICPDNDFTSEVI